MGDIKLLNDAPEDIFTHVEKSLDNGIKIGMLLEIQYSKDPETYWIASITMVCGHLLRVRYIGSQEDIWCDITKTVVKPVGWCNHFNELLDPPEGISSEDDIIDLMTNMVQNRESIPNDSIVNNGLTPIDRIHPGMKLEIQCVHDPFSFWITSVIENVGGRLRLRYDAPDNLFEDFWLFYTDKRLHDFGYAVKNGPPYRLELPNNSKNIQLSEKDINMCYQAASKLSQLNPFPEDLLCFDVKIQMHQFEVGMKLEAVNPKNYSEICPATVVKVFDSFYFLISLDDSLHEETYNLDGCWLCTLNHPYIFPIGWAETNKIKITPPKMWDKNKNFDWGEYLQINSSISAPAKYFKKPNPATDYGFSELMRLEAVNPLNYSNISSAHIVKLTKHLLHVYLDSTNCIHFFDSKSSNLFPVGWCTAQNIDLEDHKETTNDPNNSVTKKVLDLPTANSSEWSQKIYFNYKCYSGPLISKNKLSQLPKSVGPGPLSLVIREVLNMIISVAYKPAKLLKDWEQNEKPNTGQKTETLRAKLKSSTYYANIQVANTEMEVPSFCQEICVKLQACPYLFGPTEIVEEQCPENCLKVDKSKFQSVCPAEKRGRPKGIKSNMNKKKKNGKNTQSLNVQAMEKRVILDTGSMAKDDPESGNETDNSPSSTSYKSENGTRPNSPDSNSDVNVKKQRKKRELKTQFPPLEMKTRGAKLPNFALQMKEGHWNKKDVETIYSNTCAVPRKIYDSESEEDSMSSNSLDNNQDISDVSDSEEPELKKLRVTPLHDPSPTDTKVVNSYNNSNSRYVSNNPSKWTVNDMYNYLRKFDECRDIAEKLREEEIDGTAFIMLNFPTMREHLKMRMKPALNLCKHVAILKWSFLSKLNACDSY